MKQKALLLTAGALAMGLLAACGNNNPTSSSTGGAGASSSEEPTSSSVETPKVNLGKVSFTYTADYQTTVDANGGTTNFSSYKRDVLQTVNGDIDFTEGDLYLNLNGSYKDELKEGSEKTINELLYKTEAGYFYLASGETVPVAVGDEAAAVAKMKEILSSATLSDAGEITEAAFAYEENNVYEWKNFSLESSCVGPNEDYPTEIPFDLYWEDTPTITETASGKTIERKAAYIGYHTDAGISDFGKPKGGEYSAAITINVDGDNKVTGWNETYNSSTLEFNIMTPPPTVIVNGTRSFAATHGASFEKQSGEAVSKVVFDVTADANVTSYEMYTQMGADNSTMAPIASGVTEIEPKEGQYLMIKPTVAEGFKVKTATCNGVAMMNFGPFYATPAAEAGAYHIVLETETTAVATATIDGDSHVTSCAAKYIVAPNYTTNLDLNNGQFTPKDGVYLVAEYTVEDGYEIDWEASSCDYTNAEGTTTKKSFEFYGGYVVVANEVGTYAMHLVTKSTAPVVENEKTVTLSADSGCTNVTIQDFAFTGGAPTFTNIEGGKFVEEQGHFLAVAVTLADGATLRGVYVNGKATQPNNGYYTFALDGSASYAVRVETSVSTPVTVTGDHVASSEISSMSFATGAPVQVFGVNALEVSNGMFVCAKVTAEEGYEVVSVKCNGADTMLQNGWYCASANGAEAYNFTVETAAVASSKVTVTLPEGVTGQVGYLRAADYGPTFITANTDGTYDYTPMVGDRLAISLTLADGVEIESVKIDGVEAELAYGMYYTTVKVASTHSIVVTKAAAAVTTSVVRCNLDAGVNMMACKVAILPAGAYGPTYLNFDPTVNGFSWTPAEGDRLAIEVALNEGKTVDKVLIDGVEAGLQYGMYFTTVSVAAEHTIVVTTK